MAVIKLPEKDSFKLGGVILAYGFRHLAQVLHGSVNMESQDAHLMADRKHRANTGRGSRYILKSTTPAPHFLKLNPHPKV